MYGLSPEDQKTLEDVVKTFKVYGDQVKYSLRDCTIYQEARIVRHPMRGPRQHYVDSAFIDERQTLQEIRDAFDRASVAFEGLVTRVVLSQCIEINAYQEMDVSEEDFQKELLAYAIQREINKALDAVAELRKCRISTVP